MKHYCDSSPVWRSVQPILMIFEDLHWADPTSRELLDLTVEQIDRLPVLLIATFRPEYQPPWTGQPHVTTLSLRRLGRHESDELVRGIIGNTAALPREIMAEIVERTDGVPLFLEELTKAVVENAVIGSVPAASLAIPATLHASLMARLDRLGPAAKEVAQIGACIGREFSYELLAAVARRSETELQDALGPLLDAGLVFQRGVPATDHFAVQARAGAGHRLQHVAARPAPSIAREYRPRARRAISWPRGSAAADPGSPLQRSRLARAGSGVLVSRRPAIGSEIGSRRGRRAVETRVTA